jgi:hypothetical protein
MNQQAANSSIKPPAFGKRRSQVAMRKAILMVLLAVVSSSAAAEWIKLGSNEDSTFYVDAATILRKGKVATMWSLIDYRQSRTIGNAQYMSLTALGEYDCEKEQQRVVSGSRQTEKMGRGESVSKLSEPTEWSFAASGSTGEALWKFACGRR